MFEHIGGPDSHHGGGGGDARVALIEHALSAQPCGALLDQLATIDASTLEPASQVELVTAIGRAEAWLESVKLRAIAAVAGPGGIGAIYTSDFPEHGQPLSGTLGPLGIPIEKPVHLIEKAVVLEVQSALKLSQRSALHLIETGRALCYRMKPTLAAMTCGRLSGAHAHAIVDETSHLHNREQLQRIQDLVLAKPGRKTPGELRRATRRAVTIVDADAQVKRIQTAQAERRVEFWALPDGMAAVHAIVPAEKARLIYDVIDAIGWNNLNNRQTERAGATWKGIDAFRADALIELATTAANDLDTALSPAATRPLKRNAAIIIDLPTALGLADNPGEIPGYGPIPAVIARQIAKDTDWTRWITDPQTGHLLDLGKRKYRPTQPLRDYISARDRYCRVPGCSGPAQRGEIDHADEFRTHDTGNHIADTTVANLGCLCKTHHQLKTHKILKITASNPDGSAEFELPTKHHLTHPPEPILDNINYQHPPMMEWTPAPPPPHHKCDNHQNCTQCKTNGICPF